MASSNDYYNAIKECLCKQGYDPKFFEVIDPEMDKNLVSGDYDKEQYLLFCDEYKKQYHLDEIHDAAKLANQFRDRKGLIQIIGRIKQK